MFGNQPKRGRPITCVSRGDRGCQQRAGRGGAPRSESNRSVALNVDASECDLTQAWQWSFSYCAAIRPSQQMQRTSN